MTVRPCLTCGTPSAATRCPACQPAHNRTLAPRLRGYDSRWRELSRRARRMQPFCADCGATENLTTDHSAEAWARRARGQVIRLCDVAVVCHPCNVRRGSSRPGAERAADQGPPDTRPEAVSGLLTDNRRSCGSGAVAVTARPDQGGNPRTQAPDTRPEALNRLRGVGR